MQIPYWKIDLVPPFKARTFELVPIVVFFYSFYNELEFFPQYLVQRMYLISFNGSVGDYDFWSLSKVGFIPEISEEWYYFYCLGWYCIVYELGSR